MDKESVLPKAPNDNIYYLLNFGTTQKMYIKLYQKHILDFWRWSHKGKVEKRSDLPIFPSKQVYHNASSRILECQRQQKFRGKHSFSPRQHKRSEREMGEEAGLELMWMKPVVRLSRGNRSSSFRSSQMRDGKGTWQMVRKAL